VAPALARAFRGKPGYLPGMHQTCEKLRFRVQDSFRLNKWAIGIAIRFSLVYNFAQHRHPLCPTHIRLSMPKTHSSHAQFDFVAISGVIRSEKPNKGLEAVMASNPNQQNRIIGYLPDGVKVVVAQRPGRGGMDFTKLMGGKVFSVAADALSPVYEKGEDKKPTKNIKMEGGLPLYSSSGFYTLSTKDYPALGVMECYARVLPGGEQVLLVATDAITNKQTLRLESDFDLDVLTDFLVASLDDANNLVACYDEEINKKRERESRRAKEDADAANEPFEGPAFKELSVSKKDGNPLALLAWSTAAGEVRDAVIVRETEGLDDADRPVTQYLSAREAVDLFQTTEAFAELNDELRNGRAVSLAFAVGHLMRSSVSFRKKVVNTAAEPADKVLYGDAAYIRGVTTSWARSIVVLLNSQHPGFPRADYDSHFYVAAPRQAEIGMKKKPDGSGWLPPQVVSYDLRGLLLG